METERCPFNGVDCEYIPLAKKAAEQAEEIERLREALQKIADWPDYRSPSHQEIARSALKEKE